KKIPDVYSKMYRDEKGRLYLEWQPGKKAYQVEEPGRFTLKQLIGNPAGTNTGIAFDFQDPEFRGFLYYGFIHHDDGAYPYPVYFRDYELIHQGRAHIDILNSMSGKYDMINWQSNGKGTLGYRIISYLGEFLYDGKIVFQGTGPFMVGTTILEGPFLGQTGPDRVLISFKTNVRCKASIVIGDKVFSDPGKVSDHIIEVSGLSPDTEYNYTIEGVTLSNKYSLRTAPEPGSRTSFTFAYASDSRDGNGGGERNMFGVNAYIMKKIMALTLQQDARFFQFTGDLITGYTTDKNTSNLQYANWKRSVEPFWHHIPIYVGVGNHEALEFLFRDTLDGRPYTMKVDRFPFETESTEAVYMENFVMPENGPESEDGSLYDPNPGKLDFPSYKESVFHYSYDNVGMIVLNSDYWYNSTPAFIRFSGGGLHGYIMDNQLAWLEETLAMFEEDPNIDHVFVTQHTPAFPNGGHVYDDMWYNGKNDYRPYVAGKPVAKGIIERRDEFLDLLVNKSTKVVAMLTGDEHNYNRLKITNDMLRYPEPWFFEKAVLTRELWQINNGAAGAPYYAQEETPWSEHVIGFTTRNALVLINVEGQKVSLKVINPDTLELIDEAILKE
ncbi:metallophosphoesterase family protein, partial [Bacteroidota bacterium]